MFPAHPHSTMAQSYEAPAQSAQESFIYAHERRHWEKSKSNISNSAILHSLRQAQGDKRSSVEEQ